MTSLSEAYHGGRGGPSLRRLSLGFGVFIAGALLVIAGIVVTTTDVYTLGGATLGEARELGGILGGLGVPAVFLGVFAVLPASRRTRAAAVIGASIAVLGVGLFSHAYPCQWTGATCGAGLTDLTLETVGVYFFGTITTFWCLFVGVANFKTRNDPGGTATVQVTKKGETRIVEVEKTVRGGLSGIGFLGGTPDGNVETQTNSPSGSGMGGAAGATDGGASSNAITPLDLEPTEAPKTTQSTQSTQTAQTAQSTQSAQRAGGSASTAGAPANAMEHPAAERPQTATVGDRYCGNCTYFEYVRTSEGLQPYCAAHDEMMQDMEECDEWFPRSRY
ncbi:ribonuclease BN [Haloferax sp. MBLA0076]|uniref:Ribonuclease BN n=1 Tax=Haloferax litoreum TaxID=2666140 RepID=A0A6A8GEU5_9EURY|nr:MULTISPECIES: YihY/virulence factor BrkB family protein [Haloferax]KAB1192214.1 YihY/virulence factor BrkB family protein [Haloferax sp. CBA1148]MRX20667.1 ribonuclease BN [Haloferax litoreum]